MRIYQIGQFVKTNPISRANYKQMTDLSLTELLSDTLLASSIQSEQLCKDWFGGPENRSVADPFRKMDPVGKREITGDLFLEPII